MDKFTRRNKILVLVTVLALFIIALTYKITRPSSLSFITPSPIASSTLPLTVPAGFEISVFAEDIVDARVIAFDPEGRLVVSQTRKNKIVVLNDTDFDGKADEQKTIAGDMSLPHGLAFDCPIDDRNLPCYLYVAEDFRLGRFDYDAKNVSVSNYIELAEIETSESDNHFTRTLLFLPTPNEHLLLVSVGSTCNVCHEENEMHGKIMVYNTSTKEFIEYARGLRNAVFMTLDPLSGRVFATEMGRDGLGDNTPPDEINIIKQSQNYGWPTCYGKNIHDTNFDKNTYFRNPCMEPFETPSFIDLQAHSAPLGLSFIPEEGWPEDYWYNLLVAYHGSWNRTIPTGYKIVRLKMDAQGNYSGTEDFITGWIDKDGKKLGRPVDIKVFSGGVAYISDDLSGRIYKLTR